MKKTIEKLLFPLLLFLLVLVLSIVNFSKNTYLTGWDNLQVDFDLFINLERSLNVSWQEYQGLGLLGGMGHGADLIRQIFLIPFSFIFEQSFLRYFWNFTSLFIGVLGSYYLFVYFTKNRLISFLGASFYLLNIGTMQNFYVTFEPFTAFFAFFPWLFYFLLKYLNKNSRKNLFLFFLISLFGTVMGYIQTIFLVYLILLAIILLFYFFGRKVFSRKEKILNSLKILLIVFLVNAFWLLPVSFFTLTNSDATVNAKGNLMTTESVFLRNNKFGNFYDLAQLKGYWFDSVDFDQSGNMVFLLDEWKIHFQNPLAVLISFTFFALLLVGVTSLFISKKLSLKLKQSRWLLLTLFLFCCFILLGSNPPLGFIYDFLREKIPLFGQIFRSSFTKWIVPYSLFYSLFVTFSLTFVFSLLKKKIFKIIFALIFFVSLIFYSWPSFQGHFFYEKLRVQIPEVYFKAFAYFKNEVPESSRIANLPQHSFYGWQWNDWGYRGSGFLWYGIKQPILDRAFDVWSEADERYYWQLQAALDKKDVKMLENIFSQYDVDYLLLDTSIVNRNTVKPFDYQSLKELLTSSSRINLIKEFDFITLYSFADTENSREKDFVSLYKNLPIINNSYKHSWSEQAFNDFHDYLSVDKNNAENAEIIYPFASLFTNHLQKDLEFNLSEDNDFFYLTSNKPATTDFSLQLPDLLQTENYLPFHLTWTVEGNLIKLTFKALLPEIYLNDQKFTFDLTKELSLNSQFCQTEVDCFLNINNQLLSEFATNGEMDVLLNTKLRNTIALSNQTKIEYFDYAFLDLSFFDLSAKTYKVEEVADLTVKIPKVVLQSNVLKTDLNLEEAKNCRPLAGGSYFKEKRTEENYYQATGTSICDYFYLEQLQHNSAYLLRLDAQNLSSIPFVFATQAESLGLSPLETYLSDGINYQILPPTENFNQGYTLYFSTDSYGREVNRNVLRSAEVFYWPYQFLMSLNLQKENQLMQNAEFATCDFEVQKKALWLYQVNLPNNCDANYLKLSQAYDEGWLALQSGKLLKHQKINNWANAWILEQGNNDSIYLFFWPQSLEYFGFIFLLICGHWLWKKRQTFLLV